MSYFSTVANMCSHVQLRVVAASAVSAEGAARAMIQDVPKGDPWSEISARRAASARLHADGALDEVPCLACGYPSLSERGGHHFCVVCLWQDDDAIRDQPDRPSELNHGLTLRQAAVHIVQAGVFASPGWARTAPEYFTAEVRAARAELVGAYERLMAAPGDPSARQAVQDGRAKLMYAIVNARR
jgi:hypothetical protein